MTLKQMRIIKMATNATIRKSMRRRVRMAIATAVLSGAGILRLLYVIRYSSPAQSPQSDALPDSVLANADIAIISSIDSESEVKRLKAIDYCVALGLLPASCKHSAAAVAGSECGRRNLWTVIRALDGEGTVYDEVRPRRTKPIEHIEACASDIVTCLLASHNRSYIIRALWAVRFMSDMPRDQIERVSDQVLNDTNEDIVVQGLRSLTHIAVRSQAFKKQCLAKTRAASEKVRAAAIYGLSMAQCDECSDIYMQALSGTSRLVQLEGVDGLRRCKLTPGDTDALQRLRGHLSGDPLIVGYIDELIKGGTGHSSSE